MPGLPNPVSKLVEFPEDERIDSRFRGRCFMVDYDSIGTPSINGKKLTGYTAEYARKSYPHGH